MKNRTLKQKKAASALLGMTMAAHIEAAQLRKKLKDARGRLSLLVYLRDNAGHFDRQVLKAARDRALNPRELDWKLGV